ncbi:MAG: alpha/beta hydrolase [Gracilimonas sp.]|nr:alpha/beta hydrolase [Gracilimonas sp.]
MKHFLVITIGWFLSPLGYAQVQNVNFPRDTSYTIHSAYQKYVKDYPQIKIANPDIDGQINIQRNLVYKSTDNRVLRLDVFTSQLREENTRPTVLLIHGGGWISGNKSLLHPLAKEIADHGFAAIAIEYRLSLEAQYPAAVQDIKTAIKWIKDHAHDFNIDSERIAILGTSAGGQLAALVGTTAKDHHFEDPSDTSNATTEVQAIVDIDGILAFIHPDSKEGVVAGKWLGGDQKEVRGKWIEASALTHVDELTPPMLFIGSSYPRFLAGREEAIEVLDHHGIQHKTYTFDDAPHSFWLFHPWFEPTVEQVIHFLDMQLK